MSKDNDNDDWHKTYRVDENGKIVEDDNIRETLEDEGEVVNIDLALKLSKEEKAQLKQVLQQILDNGMEFDDDTQEVWQFLNAN